MLKNYFKIAWRNVFKNKASSFINIGGLAVGMTVALLIGLWIYDELSFNKYHKNYNSIARVMQNQVLSGKKYTQKSAPLPLGKELENKYGSDFKYIVMSSWGIEHILTAGETKLSRTGIYMDKDAAAMLSLKMLKGNYDGLKEPNSILLSASAAKAAFGDADPMNKLVKIDNQLNVKVTGVYEDLPRNTEFKDLKFIAPWDLYITSQPWLIKERDEPHWDNNSFQILVQLADHVDIDALNKKIIQIKQNNVAPEDKKLHTEIFLHPMRDWHLRSHWVDGKQTGGLIEYVWLFSIVGIFVLILACINFMNLSTARSEKRAKEVGIRKAIGSFRGQLVNQFYSESLLVVLFAFIFSLILVQLILPWFNQVADKKMVIPWLNPFFWLIGITVTFLTGIIAGSYPALYLSSFQPVKVLKGTFRIGRFASMPRKVLVVLQFTISLTLIIGTIIVYNQIQFSKNRPVGYNRDGLMMITMKSEDFYGKLDILRTELKNQGAIEEMAESSSPLTWVWASNNGFEWQGKDPELNADFATIWVTHEFGKTIGWKFKEGRDFSREFSTDSSAIILNEAAVKFMGIKNPVGTIVRWGNNKYKIVGVIKDMLMDSPYDNARQTIYFMDSHDANFMILKLNPNKSASESIAKVEAAFKQFIPSAPFDYKFADREFAAKFATEERVGKLSTFFTILAVFISCMGLFGLASFVAEQRTKEIGIRKVLGASVANLWGMLSKDFVVLVCISCLIAIPVAWYLMSEWLQKYTYHTAINWWVFVIAGCGGLILTLLTVSFQAIKAAIANPVKSLKTD
ncbi:ABC-type antimicrobial peptide transport system, permease component [Chitinophaga sp. YR573]|uniref:ABC transporter permease n=1 Tax=Chitinophaga sp. YR573 TaxID=1881040 RepID=UPI0008BD5E2F|nr:ABC transporter permease [Chitinophaga sp. YR573]SEW28018.1 ABC-type antimicrobial peptide transport system, permease component [Chitinophaga sp. YR573]